MSNRSEAIKHFQYYFRLIAREAGVRWDSDNDAEIGYAVERIFDEIEKTNEQKIKNIVYDILEECELIEPDADIPGDFGTHQVVDIG